MIGKPKERKLPSLGKARTPSLHASNIILLKNLENYLKFHASIFLLAWYILPPSEKENGEDDHQVLPPSTKSISVKSRYVDEKYLQISDSEYESDVDESEASETNSTTEDEDSVPFLSNELLKLNESDEEKERSKKKSKPKKSSTSKIKTPEKAPQNLGLISERNVKEATVKPAKSPTSVGYISTENNLEASNSNNAAQIKASHSPGVSSNPEVPQQLPFPSAKKIIPTKGHKSQILSEELLESSDSESEAVSTSQSQPKEASIGIKVAKEEAQNEVKYLEDEFFDLLDAPKQPAAIAKAAPKLPENDEKKKKEDESKNKKIIEKKKEVESHEPASTSSSNHLARLGLNKLDLDRNIVEPKVIDVLKELERKEEEPVSPKLKLLLSPEKAKSPSPPKIETKPLQQQKLPEATKKLMSVGEAKKEQTKPITETKKALSSSVLKFDANTPLIEEDFLENCQFSVDTPVVVVKRKIEPKPTANKSPLSPAKTLPSPNHPEASTSSGAATNSTSPRLPKPSTLNAFTEAACSSILAEVEIVAVENHTEFDASFEDSEEVEDERLLMDLRYKIDTQYNVVNYRNVNEMKRRIARSIPKPKLNHLINFWMARFPKFPEMVLFYQYLQCHVDKYVENGYIHPKIYQSMIQAVGDREQIFDSHKVLASDIPLMCELKFLCFDSNYQDFVYINPEILRIQVFPFAYGLPSELMFCFTKKKEWKISELRDIFASADTLVFYQQLHHFVNDRPDLVILETPTNNNIHFPDMSLKLNDRISPQLFCFNLEFMDTSIFEYLHLRNDHIKSLKQFMPFRER